MHGIAWVMNHCVSYVIVSIGLLDLFAAAWIATDTGRVLSFWIAGWWFLRAGCQIYLGRRRGDWLALAWFSTLGLLHIVAVLS